MQPLLSQLNDSYTITWLDHLPVPRILETVAELPPDSLG